MKNKIKYRTENGIAEGFIEEENSYKALVNGVWIMKDSIIHEEDKFQEGDRVKVIETGYQARVKNPHNELLGEIKVLVRFYGRHSFDLFKEEELELVKRKK